MAGDRSKVQERYRSVLRHGSKSTPSPPFAKAAKDGAPAGAKASLQSESTEWYNPPRAWSIVETTDTEQGRLGRPPIIVKHSFLRWLVMSAVLGLLAPITWLLVQKLLGANAQIQTQIAPLERVIRVVWPSSLWLMATDGIEGTPKAYMFVSLSIVANIVLYGLLGSAVWAVKRLVAVARK